MTNADKAIAIRDAAKKLSEEYRIDNDQTTAWIIINAFNDLSDGSAALLFDIIRSA